jgi:hypothetical protein
MASAIIFKKNTAVAQLLGQQLNIVISYNRPNPAVQVGTAGTRRPTQWGDPWPPPARSRASLSPADFRRVKRPHSLGAWLLTLRWVSAHLTSTFVTSCVTKVEVLPTSTTI